MTLNLINIDFWLTLMTWSMQLITTLVSKQLPFVRLCTNTVSQYTSDGQWNSIDKPPLILLC